MMIRNCLVVLLFFVQCQFAHAQDVRIKLENCKIDQAMYNKIRASLSFQLTFYSRIFNAPPAREFRARIFKTQSEWAAFSKKNINYNPLKRNAAAYYSPATKEMILHLEVTDFAKVFAHELSHALHYYYAGNRRNDTNDWVHEGVAFLLEDMVVTDSTYYLDDGSANKWRYVVGLYAQGMSFEKVYEHVENYQDYVLAWSATFYLYRSNKEVLYNIIRGEPFESGDQFKSLYPGGLQQLNIDSRSFFLNAVP